MSELIGYLKNNEIIDTHSLENIDTSALEKIYFNNSPQSLQIIRHTCAHLMAHAIKELYPSARFFVGPVVDEGFYYDFSIDEGKIGEGDLTKIESKMKEIAKKGYHLEKITKSREDVMLDFQGDSLKQKVLERIDSNDLSIYSQGNFYDLCKGPHLPNLKMLTSFKLTKLAGAYLGGDERNEMLTRIYGIAFADKESLREYLAQLEEAKKRDHRKLGNEMELFGFDEDIGAGLPIWLPRGARLRQRIEQLLTLALIKNEYEPVRGPGLLKSDVWKISGHYDNYGENMYFTQIEDIEYGIKPMNCVGHIKVYQSKIRSYKDLPLRFYEYGVVHRHEKSGVLHGLLRVREFTQDDAHIFCQYDQIEDEVSNIIAFTHRVLSAFNFEYTMELSTKPEKFIGQEAIWESATNSLKKALQKHNINYTIDEGGGAFYGPKIDIKITDAIGRKWQCGTVQIDMNLPERFNLFYINDENAHTQPVMIHRAILGSFERFIAILIEHYGGEFPFFIAPTQTVIIPVNANCLDYTTKLRLDLRENGIYSEINNKNETLSKKIRSAEKQKVPFIIVVGDNEVSNNTLAIRDRHKKDANGNNLQYNKPYDEFLQQLLILNREVSF